MRRLPFVHKRIMGCLRGTLLLLHLGFTFTKVFGPRIGAIAVQWYCWPPLTRYVSYIPLCLDKDKVWGALSQGEARCLLKKAAQSGNVGVFNTAKEGVLMRGTVSTTIMSSNEPQESIHPQQNNGTPTIFTTTLCIALVFVFPWRPSSGFPRGKTPEKAAIVVTTTTIYTRLGPNWTPWGERYPHKEGRGGY